MDKVNSQVALLLLGFEGSVTLWIQEESQILGKLVAEMVTIGNLNNFSLNQIQRIAEDLLAWQTL